ncbi:hypothetical protein [Arthrobacter sp. KBS0703]|nr:hypothetical protein [Arthrobacter sp. KBS0703]
MAGNKTRNEIRYYSAFGSSAVLLVPASVVTIMRLIRHRVRIC